MIDRRKFISRCSAALAGVAVVSALFSGSAAAEDTVNVRYSWKLKGEYAPFYMGVEKGLYSAKNLNVRLGEGAGAPAALGALIQGQEDVVILPGIFALSAIQKGMPIKVVALYQPATPLAIISHPESPIMKPKDLEGKTIAHAIGETGTSYLQAFCTINKVDCGKVKKIQMDAQARVPQFLQNKVDAVSVYFSNDLPVLEEKAGHTFPTLDLAKYGLNVPGMAVVASDDGIKKKADVLKRFLAATDQAIRATEADPAAASEAILKVWQGGPSAPVVTKQVQATIVSIKAPKGKPVGWMNNAQIESALKLLQSNNEVEGKLKPVETFYTNELLPN